MTGLSSSRAACTTRMSSPTTRATGRSGDSPRRGSNPERPPGSDTTPHSGAAAEAGAANSDHIRAHSGQQAVPDDRDIGLLCTEIGTSYVCDRRLPGDGSTILVA